MADVKNEIDWNIIKESQMYFSQLKIIRRN